jgi:hypothetical protein
MENNNLNIAEIAKEHAIMTVKSLALAQSMNLVSTEEDLTNLISAGIETALEDFLISIKETGKND